MGGGRTMWSMSCKSKQTMSIDPGWPKHNWTVLFSGTVHHFLVDVKCSWLLSTFRPLPKCASLKIHPYPSPLPIWRYSFSSFFWPLVSLPGAGTGLSTTHPLIWSPLHYFLDFSVWIFAACHANRYQTSDVNCAGEYMKCMGEFIPDLHWPIWYY